MFFSVKGEHHTTDQYTDQLIFLYEKDESTSSVFLPFFLFCYAFFLFVCFCFFFRILEQDCEKINVICNLL